MNTPEVAWSNLVEAQRREWLDNLATALFEKRYVRLDILKLYRPKYLTILQHSSWLDLPSTWMMIHSYVSTCASWLGADTYLQQTPIHAAPVLVREICVIDNFLNDR